MTSCQGIGQHNVSLAADWLCGWGSAVRLLVKSLPLFSLSTLYSLEGSHKVWSTLNSFAPPWGESIYRNYVEFFSMGDLSPLPALFSHSFTDISMDVRDTSYFGLYCNTALFYCGNHSNFGRQAPMAPMSLCHIPLLWVFKYFLTFCTMWCCRLVLWSSCPSCRSSHFSTEPWFLLMENGVKNPDLGTHTCSWLHVVTSRSL